MEPFGCVQGLEKLTQLMDMALLRQVIYFERQHLGVLRTVDVSAETNDKTSVEICSNPRLFK